MRRKILIFFTFAIITLLSLSSCSFFTSQEGFAKKEAGLYDHDELMKSWKQLLSEGILSPDGECLPDKQNSLAGGLVLSSKLTSIPAEAFSRCEYLSSITIPKSITSIGKGAFADCSRLKKVYFEGSLEDWCNITFASKGANPCYNGAELYIDGKLVESVTFPNDTEKVGNYVFYNCQKINSITIPEGITGIGRFSFYNCSDITEITLPDSITSISSSAFAGCENLQKITVSKNIETIGDRAFLACKKLKTVYYNGSLEQWCQIKYETDRDQFNLNSFNTDLLMANPCSNGADLYIGDKLVTEIEFPATIESINEGAFAGCNSLRNITIPLSVTRIEKNAFEGCVNLNSVTIENCTAVYDGSTFSGCPLTEGISVNHAQELLTINTPINDSQHTSIVTCTKCDKTISDETKAHEYVGSGPCTICGRIIYGLYKTGSNYTVLLKTWDELVDEGILTSTGTIVTGREPELAGDLFVSDTVTKIKDNSFNQCIGLTGIIIPYSVTNIGEYAFCDCENLVRITFMENSQLTSISSFAFRRCINLIDVIIPEKVTSIEPGVFDGCTGLTSLTVAEKNVTYYSESNCIIERSTKALVTGCKNSKIPDGVASIKEAAFLRCAALESINIPKSVKRIDSWAFAGCTELANIIFAENTALESIGDHAFVFCEGLTSIILPYSVTFVGNYAFAECDSLTNITLPVNITYLGCSSFESCINLTRITFKGTIRQWSQIIKEPSWNHFTGEYTIYCTNGSITKAETAIRT